MNIIITICARGGSKGIPGKNIKPMAGKPLIAYTIERAKEFAVKYKATIALSTDDYAIRETAAKLGLPTTYQRPEALATDAAGKMDTINDLLLHEEKLLGEPYDFILDMDITSPLRTLEDLEKAFAMMKENSEALSLFSVNNAARNPYFNMVEEAPGGFYSLVKKGKDGVVMSRQAAPKVYDLNASFYWYRRAFFEKGFKSPITERSIVFVMDHTCFDLDHVIDFDFLEYLILNNKITI